MKFVVVVCAVVAGVAIAFPENRAKRSPQSTIVEVIPVEVFEVPPIPSVLAFDFDAARAGKSYSPSIGSEDKAEAKAEEKKEVTKRDEDATEEKQKEKEEKKEQVKEEEEEGVRPEEQIDVRVDEEKEGKTEETPKE